MALRHSFVVHITNLNLGPLKSRPSLTLNSLLLLQFLHFVANSISWSQSALFILSRLLYILAMRTIYYCCIALENFQLCNWQQNWYAAIALQVELRTWQGHIPTIRCRIFRFAKLRTSIFVLVPSCFFLTLSSAWLAWSYIWSIENT